MEEFHVPEDISNLKSLQIQTSGRFCVSEDIPTLRDENEEQLDDRLDDLVPRLYAGNRALLAERDNSDEIFAFVRDFQYLPSKVKGKILQILCNELRRLVPLLGGGGSSDDYEKDHSGSEKIQGLASLDLRNAFKIAMYLLYSASYPAEDIYSSTQNEVLDKPTKGPGSRGGKKAKGSGHAFAWNEARETVLDAMSLALTVDPIRLWRQGVPDRAFMLLFLRITCKMLELPETVKNGGQSALELLSGPFRLAQGMESEVSAATFLLVREHKHMPLAIARLCQHMVEKHGDARLGAELVREIGRMEMPLNTNKNTAAAAPVANVSSFLRELVTVLPGTVHTHVSILLPHLNSHPHQIRNAVVFTLGEIVTAATRERKDREESREGRDISTLQGRDPGGVQVDPRRVHMTDRNRDALLDQLVERALDVSPYVRSSVLRGWATIAEREALPRKRFLTAVRLAADRLRDHASLVRKEAARLLATLLEYNPFNSTLNLEVHQRSRDQAEAELRAMVPCMPDSDGARGQGGLSPEACDGGRGRQSEGSDDEPCTEREDADESDLERDGDDATSDTESGAEGADMGAEEYVAGATGCLGAEQDSGADRGDEPTEEMKAHAAKVAQCEHWSAAVLFIQELGMAKSRLGEMLRSKTTSDVVEALRFFVTACRFELPGALDMIKKSLTLIWRTEGSIEVEIKRAFVEVFIQPAPKTDETESRGTLPAQQVARNLSELVKESRPGELASLEEVVSSLVKDTVDAEKDTQLDLEVFEELWCAVASRGQPPEYRAAALHAIAMGASAEQSLVNNADRLGVIRETALGRVVMEKRDWRTVRCACIALLRCDPELEDVRGEIEMILKRLMYFLQGKWCVRVTQESAEEEKAAANSEMKDWFAAAEQALAVLFHLSPEPEVLGGMVTRRMASDTLSSDSASPLALARLCFVLGHLAIMLLVYTEDLAGHLARARAKVKPTAGARDKNSGGPCESSEAKQTGDDDDDDDGTAQELGLTAEAAAEDEQRLAELVETEIVGRNLLGAFGPLLVRIVADEGKVFGHPLIRQSSVLALSKFMCVSGGFCERHLDLLFTVMEREKDDAVRSNIVVALGDLAFRFPNALEPWNPRIYARLRDRCPRVRANAIMVLTHLILNDMVKVKGQVSELALCIVDDEPRIEDAARVFFQRYSERGQNPIYNMLPDIVGRLSADDSVSPSDFHTIMDFLMKYVTKDRLTEMLAEKLCARLTATDGERQRRAVSYCIGQLKVTEQAVVRITELVPSYKEQMRDREVYSNLMALVSRTRKLAKTEMQEALNLLEKELKKYHEGGADDEDAAVRATEASRRRSSKSVSGNGVGVEGPRRRGASASEVGTKKGKNPSRTRRTVPKPPVIDTSSEDGDETSVFSDNDSEEDRDLAANVRQKSGDRTLQDEAQAAAPRRRGAKNSSTSAARKARSVKVVDQGEDPDEEAEAMDWGSDDDVFEPRVPLKKKGGSRSDTKRGGT